MFLPKFIFLLIVFLFVAIGVLCIIKQTKIQRGGRIVDARVVSCEKPNFEYNGEYVNVDCDHIAVVEFEGALGDLIQKKLSTKTPYEIGSVIRCRYNEGADLIMKESDISNKNIVALVGMIIFAVALGAVIIFLPNM